MQVQLRTKLLSRFLRARLDLGAKHRANWVFFSTPSNQTDGVVDGRAGSFETITAPGLIFLLFCLFSPQIGVAAVLLKRRVCMVFRCTVRPQTPPGTSSDCQSVFHTPISRDQPGKPGRRSLRHWKSVHISEKLPTTPDKLGRPCPIGMNGGESRVPHVRPRTNTISKWLVCERGRVYCMCMCLCACIYRYFCLLDDKATKPCHIEHPRHF